MSRTAVQSPTRSKRYGPGSRRDYSDRDLLAVAAARRLGKQPGTVLQWMHGRREDSPIGRLVAMYAAAVEVGQRDRLERLLDELDQLRLGIHGAVLTPALIVRAAVADADENERAFAFVTTPCLATLDAWVEKLHAERHAKLEVLGALLVERARMARETPDPPRGA